MEQYKDINGDSAVKSYEIGESFVKVKFNSGSVYLYTYASAGFLRIEQMKKLAIAGDGLNSFISEKARKAYESIER